MRKMRLMLILIVGAILFDGCHAQPTVAHTQTVWYVGPFVVRRTTVIPSVFNDRHQAVVGSKVVLRVGTSPPYIVSRKPLGHGQWKTISKLQCAAQPSWTGIQGPAASLLCIEKPPAASRLVLVYPSGVIESYGISVRLPQPVPSLFVTGRAYGGMRGQIIWWVYKNAEPPVYYGSGVLDLVSGRCGTIGPLADKKTQQLSFVLAPNDSLFGVQSVRASRTSTSKNVYRWSTHDSMWVEVGRVSSSLGADAIDDNGTIWTYRPAEGFNDLDHWVIEREVPGSHQVDEWPIVGNLIGIGPGYAVFTPYTNSSSVNVFFPLQHRTLRFSGLVGPVSLQATVLGVGEMGVPNEFGPQNQVVLVGNRNGIEALTISTK